MNVMVYDVERCDGYYDLCGFLDDANRYGYEIISMTEQAFGYKSKYTVLYRMPTKDDRVKLDKDPN